MLTLIQNRIEFDYDKCQQCGICAAVCPKNAITTKLLDNGTHRIIVDHTLCITCKKCINCCPANRKTDFSGYFDEMPQKHYFLGYNKDSNIRRGSSSGGACKTIIIESLKKGLVDGVYTMKKLPNYPSGEGEFYTQNNIPTYAELSNSIYHSVMLGTNISKVQKCERLMIVGTSCQLYALEKALRGKYKELIKVCIFCKQQKTLESTRFIAKSMGTHLPIDKSKITTQYRGEGWPGIVSLMGNNISYSAASQLPFGRRLWTIGGCNICGDPFCINDGKADISLMDPWCIRKANDLGETLITAHSEKGLSLLENNTLLALEKLDYNAAKPALGEADILKKQLLVNFFKGNGCSFTIKLAGRMEQIQRYIIRNIVEHLPKMPLLIYKIIYKTPDLRNLILKIK